MEGVNPCRECGSEREEIEKETRHRVYFKCANCGLRKGSNPIDW